MATKTIFGYYAIMIIYAIERENDGADLLIN